MLVVAWKFCSLFWWLLDFGNLGKWRPQHLAGNTWGTKVLANNNVIHKCDSFINCRILNLDAKTTNYVFRILSTDTWGLSWLGGRNWSAFDQIQIRQVPGFQKVEPYLKPWFCMKCSIYRVRRANKINRSEFLQESGRDSLQNRWLLPV